MLENLFQIVITLYKKHIKIMKTNLKSRKYYRIKLRKKIKRVFDWEKNGGWNLKTKNNGINIKLQVKLGTL